MPLLAGIPHENEATKSTKSLERVLDLTERRLVSEGCGPTFCLGKKLQPRHGNWAAVH